MPSNIFIHSSQGLTDSLSGIQGARTLWPVEEAADARRPIHASTQVERAALLRPCASAAQDTVCTAERAVCACLKRLVSEARQGRA